MRVLMPLHGFAAWNGGLDLMRSMSAAVNTVARNRGIELAFAVPNPSLLQRSMEGALRRLRVMRSKEAAGAAGNTQAVLARAVEQITSDCRIFVVAASAKGIDVAANRFDSDVVFPTMLPLGRTRRKRIGYIFDCQHHHLPHFFSPRTRANRDRRFAAVARDGDGIVVNARTVADDAVRFLGLPRERILSMPFAPYAMPWWFDADPLETRDIYGVGARYLMVCNHFWVHKDHETAIRALALLQAEHRDIELVMTGDPVDHRDPAHYARLIDMVARLGLQRRTHFLGLIPKRHQLALMRAAAAVVQPTRFEGGPGGGAVAEAIGLGVPSVVSDIPVNREVDIGDVRFFSTGDHEDLASKLRESLAETHAPPAQSELVEVGNRSLTRLGNAIADFLASIASNGQARR